MRNKIKIRKGTPEMVAREISKEGYSAQPCFAYEECIHHAIIAGCAYDCSLEDLSKVWPFAKAKRSSDTEFIVCTLCNSRFNQRLVNSIIDKNLHNKYARITKLVNRR